VQGFFKYSESVDHNDEELDTLPESDDIPRGKKQMLTISEIRVAFDLKPYCFDEKGNPRQNLSTKNRSHR
jgi:hypothetical protein